MGSCKWSNIYRQHNTRFSYYNIVSFQDANIFFADSAFTTEDNSVLYTGAGGKILAATTTSTDLCLVSNGENAAPAWEACPGGSGSNWNVANGAISPKLASVLDLLIGGTGTTSAKFAITGVNGSTSPVATLSATTSSGGSGSGIVLDSSVPSIQSLLGQT